MTVASVGIPNLHNPDILLRGKYRSQRNINKTRVVTPHAGNTQGEEPRGHSKQRGAAESIKGKEAEHKRKEAYTARRARCF
jgi:hypothetical protein